MPSAEVNSVEMGIFQLTVERRGYETIYSRNPGDENKMTARLDSRLNISRVGHKRMHVSKPQNPGPGSADN